MESFTVLDQAEEDKLHATRLLGIEERPFKRLTKRLLAPNTPIHTFLTRPAQPDENDVQSTEPSPEPAYFSDEQHQQFIKDLQRFRADVILDFAAFESSIARIQFLRTANEKERERYAAEKVKIESTAQDVRDNTAQLRIQLDEAKRTLAIRKTYDVLADEITKDSALKPRDEQHVNIEKLKAEIEELERESVEHSQAWIDRREQLEKVMGEGMRMRRLIRDEKEPELETEEHSQDRERERDDDDEDGGEGGNNRHNDEDDNMLGVEGDHGSNFGGTPRPHDQDGPPTPMPPIHDSGVLTPRSILPDGSAVASQPDIVKITRDTELGVSGLRNESHASEDEEGHVTAGGGDKMDTT